MVSALDSGASSLGLSPGWGHCVVFLGSEFHGSPHINIWIRHSIYGYIWYGSVLYMWASMKFLPFLGKTLYSHSAPLHPGV